MSKATEKGFEFRAISCVYDQASFDCLPGKGDTGMPRRTIHFSGFSSPPSCSIPLTEVPEVPLTEVPEDAINLQERLFLHFEV